MAQGIGDHDRPVLFNSTLEAGLRSLVILDATYPRGFDLSEMTWLDHLVVHTADIGGPPSLHPEVPHRSGELLVRRPLIEQGLVMMRRQHLIAIESGTRGLLYKASDDGVGIVDNRRSGYSIVLKERARWLAETIGLLSTEDLKGLVDRRLGRWSIEFDAPEKRVRP
ncbi:MAG: hypothetical protein C0607_03515 [Azoarcus sp.]|nr:MAG: hypothetical protein C0607_03515 [Azoarcus sp.]